MSRHERRYQRYLAPHQKRENWRSQTIPAQEMSLAAHAPIHESLVPASLFEQGIGNLLFSRSLPDGRVALGAFLLDVFCLGVKNAFFCRSDPR